MPEPAVQSFGKYQILEKIATGGMAEIYKARLEGIGGFQRTFAIKRILPHLSRNQDYVGMLVDEAKVAGLLSHANIVQILDLGQVNDVWYIAMEYVDGFDLAAILKRCEERGLTLPVPHAVFIAIQLLKGLEYAHDRQVMRAGKTVPLNIIHRDVSPPNVLVSAQGEVKLTDFGIARAAHKALQTQAGVIKGRFDYMSPEQASAVPDLDRRSDLFSAGVLLYEMLAGQHPFRAENELKTLDRASKAEYQPLSVVNPDVPFSLEAIVDRAMRPERDERYPTAGAFKEALDKFFHDAGFIFTSATLSAYLKGLFPDHGRGTGKAAAGRVAVPSREPSDFEDLPTGGFYPGSDDSEDPEESLRFGPGEEATLIKQNPLLDADDGPAPANVWADEMETVIRPGLTERAMERPTVVETPPPAAASKREKHPILQRTPLPKPPSQERPVRAVPEPAPEVPVERPTDAPTAVGQASVWRTVVIGGALLTVGVLAGVLGTVGVYQIVAYSEGANVAIVDVRAPPTAKVTVDGQAVSVGPLSVPPGLPHAVVVSIPGQEPVEATVQVRPGERHILQVTVPVHARED